MVIFSNSSHLEWKVGLSDTILKWIHPRTIPTRFSVTWFSGFRGEDLNVIFYQNISNLHNRFKSAERKISQNSPEYISISQNCSYMASSSLTYIPGFSVKFFFQPIYTDYANTAAILNGERSCLTQF
jgi:hypothetical protein